MESFQLGSYIRGTMKNIKRFINSRLKPYNLSEGHFEYFINIYHNQGMKQNDLSEKMNQSKAGLQKQYGGC
jgi:predicted transcriptional regulator